MDPKLDRELSPVYNLARRIDEQIFAYNDSQLKIGDSVP